MDLYFTTIYSGNFARLYRNDGSWNFADVTEIKDLQAQPPTYMAAWADYDRDGDLDLATSGWVYRNDESGDNWLEVSLHGDGVNISTTAIGAVVRADVNGQTITRQIGGGVGQGNQNDQTLHFGLGGFADDLPLEITWPDGTVQTALATPNEHLDFYHSVEGEVVDIGEVGQLTSVTHLPQTVTLTGTYFNPVVIAQSASANEIEPAVVRITDVQSDQFTIYLAEPSDASFGHGGETVTYLVMEAGQHRLVDGTLLEAGTADTAKTVGSQLGNSWDRIEFTTEFSTTPVVFSQAQTTNGSSLLQTRHLVATASSFLFALEQEEAAVSPNVEETVGYLAVEPGSGLWNGMPYHVNNTPVAVSDGWYDLSYPSPFSSTPSLITSLATYREGDSAHVRYANSLPTGVKLKVEEDTTFDSETTHDDESVAYLAIGGQGRLTAVAPVIEIGEVGRITDLTDQPHLVVLQREYAHPVVFAQSASTSDSDPAVVRVTDVESDRFTMFLAEPFNEDGVHSEPETVTYLVLEAGQTDSDFNPHPATLIALAGVFFYFSSARWSFFSRR